MGRALESGFRTRLPAGLLGWRLKGQSPVLRSRPTIGRLKTLVARIFRPRMMKYTCDCCQDRQAWLWLRLASGATIRLCHPCESRLKSWLIDQSQDYGPDELGRFRRFRR